MIDEKGLVNEFQDGDVLRKAEVVSRFRGKGALETMLLKYCREHNLNNPFLLAGLIQGYSDGARLLQRKGFFSGSLVGIVAAFGAITTWFLYEKTGMPTLFIPILLFALLFFVGAAQTFYSDSHRPIPKELAQEAALWLGWFAEMQTLLRVKSMDQLLKMYDLDVIKGIVDHRIEKLVYGLRVSRRFLQRLEEDYPESHEPLSHARQGVRTAEDKFSHYAELAKSYGLTRPYGYYFQRADEQIAKEEAERANANRPEVVNARIVEAADEVTEN